MEGLGTLLFWAALFFLLMRFGCGAHMIRGRGAHGESKHDNRKNKHIDPVCDMEVEVDQGYGKMYEGELYRFCSRSCLDKFDSDPQRYLNKLQGEQS